MSAGRYVGGIPFDKVIFVEGASESTFCTSWCKEMPSTYHKDGHSIDGTLEHIKAASSNNPDIIKVVTTNGLWNGKMNMFNEAIKHITEPCYLWQIDVDEYWKVNQLSAAEKILDNTGADVGTFNCDYMLSNDVIVRGTWGESSVEGYTRLWKYQPGRKFIAHEPPIIEGSKMRVPPKFMPRFMHLSYFYEEDVKFKSQWYGGHENVYTNWCKIKDGSIKLPCGIDSLFGRPVQAAWKDTIVTYA